MLQNNSIHNFLLMKKIECLSSISETQNSTTPKIFIDINKQETSNKFLEFMKENTKLIILNYFNKQSILYLMI